MYSICMLLTFINVPNVKLCPGRRRHHFALGPSVRQIVPQPDVGDDVTGFEILVVFVLDPVRPERNLLLDYTVDQNINLAKCVTKGILVTTYVVRKINCSILRRLS